MGLGTGWQSGGFSFFAEVNDAKMEVGGDEANFIADQAGGKGCRGIVEYDARF
jgi:hypothetical protein